MNKLLQTMKLPSRSLALAFAMIMTYAMTAVGQSITVSLVEGTEACTYPIDLLVATDGLAPNNTIGSATIDIQYDPTLVVPSTGGSLPLPSPPYTDGFNPLPAGCSIPGGTCNVLRYKLTSGDVGDEFGETPGTDITTPFGLWIDLCFEDVVTSPGKDVAASKTQVAPSFTIADSSLSVGFYDSPNNSNGTGVIVDCRTPIQGSNGTIGFDCTVIDLVPLPVELADFTALVDNGDVVLTWTTASETDNAGFSVEHATGENGSFEEIAFVDGAGTSLEARTYTYAVKGLDVGNHRFRLKQLDYDGSFELSSVVETTIELAGTHRLGAAYPNPFNPSTTFELVVGREQHVKIDVMNALGQRVQRLFDGSMEANRPTNFTFQAGNLPTGLYFYRVVGETFAQTRQALLVK